MHTFYKLRQNNSLQCETICRFPMRREDIIYALLKQRGEQAGQQPCAVSPGGIHTV